MVQILKRDGSLVPFNKNKIIVAINKAFLEVDGTLYETDTATDIANEIGEYVAKRNGRGVKEVRQMLTNVMGIIFGNSNDVTLNDLTSIRALSSVPFGGRYRLIDFVLSSMVNSGIGKVGVSTKANYQSLMDHLGSGKPWDLSRKREGMTLLPPFESVADILIFALFPKKRIAILPLSFPKVIS